MRLANLSSVHLKCAGEVANFIFLKNKQGNRACVGSNIPVCKKCRLYAVVTHFRELNIIALNGLGFFGSELF